MKIEPGLQPPSAGNDNARHCLGADGQQYELFNHLPDHCPTWGKDVFDLELRLDGERARHERDRAHDREYNSGHCQASPSNSWRPSRNRSKSVRGRTGSKNALQVTLRRPHHHRRGLPRCGRCARSSPKPAAEYARKYPGNSVHIRAIEDFHD